MFQGLSRVDHWPTHQLQLRHAIFLFEDYLRHIDKLVKAEVTGKDISVEPVGSYIKILGDAGQHDRILEAYHQLKQHPVLSPNAVVYTAIFRAITTQRQKHASAEPTTANDADIPSSIMPSKPTLDAKVLWMDLTRANNKKSVVIDTHLIAAAIRALSEGSASDQSLAFDIFRDHLGLVRPNETPRKPLIEGLLDVHTLAAILDLCNDMRQYDLCIHFAGQISHSKRTPENPSPWANTAMDRPNVERVLRAHAALVEVNDIVQSRQSLSLVRSLLEREITEKDPRLRPTMSTYNLLFTVCRRAVDWESTTDGFFLMSGFDTEQFKGVVAGPLKHSKRSPGKILIPDIEAMSSIARTALDSKQEDPMRQCVRMTEAVGFNHLLSGKTTNRSEDMETRNERSRKSDAFFRFKFATALTGILDILSHCRRSPRFGPEFARWQAMSKQCKDVLDQVRYRATPQFMHEVMAKTASRIPKWTRTSDRNTSTKPSSPSHSMAETRSSPSPPSEGIRGNLSHELNNVAFKASGPFMPNSF